MLKLTVLLNFYFFVIGEATFKNVEVCLINNVDTNYCAVRIRFDKIDFRSDNLPKFNLLAISKHNIPVIHENAIVDFPYSALDIKQCNVTEIRPGAFKNFRTKTAISLIKNRITEVAEDVFSNLPNITSVYLDFNEINEVHPGAFSNMRDLEMVSLSNNKIQQWDNTWFKRSPVKSIYMQENQIEYFPKGALEFISHLKFINLSKNKMMYVHPHAFLPSIRKIVMLDLSHNDIHSLPENLFQNVTVSLLDLGNNQFSCFPEPLENFFSKVTLGVVNDNPLSCDCVKKLRRMSKFRFQKIVSTLECKSELLVEKL